MLWILLLLLVFRTGLYEYTKNMLWLREKIMGFVQGVLGEIL